MNFVAADRAVPAQVRQHVVKFIFVGIKSKRRFNLQLTERIAEYLLGGFIPLDNPALAVNDTDGVGRVCQDIFEVFFGLHDFIFGLAAGGDVNPGADNMGNAPFSVLQ